MPLAARFGKAGNHWGNPESASRETCQCCGLNGRTGCSATMRQALRRGSGIPRFAPNGLGLMSVTLHVCTTCKANLPVVEGDLPTGARLHAALAAAGAPDGVRIVAVECLSACNQGAAVALSAKGRWSYVYGRLTEADAADILAGAAAYAKTTDGLVPWRERPTIFRKQSLARIPPMEL